MSLVQQAVSGKNYGKSERTDMQNKRFLVVEGFKAPVEGRNVHE